MQSAWHNLPAVNGVDQGAGAGFRARDVAFAPGRDTVRLSLDIASAYPPEAKVTRWRREVALDRKRREVVFTEEFALGEAREPLRLHFLTPLAADVATPGRVALSRTGGAPPSPEVGHVLLYDGKRFTASVEEKAVTDARLRPVWGDRLFRIVLTARESSRTGSHRVVVRSAR
jgi:hypothetical protein